MRFGALGGNTAGNSNAAVDDGALLGNTEGGGNTAVGVFALNNNTTGINNIGVGSAAGANLTTGSYNTDIGNSGVRGESSAIRVGTQGIQTATFVAGIRTVSVQGPPSFAGGSRRKITPPESGPLPPVDAVPRSLLLLSMVTLATGLPPSIPPEKL